MNSLKSRLLIVLLLVALLFWGLTVAIWVRYLLHQETGHRDEMFQAVAGLILSSVPVEIELLANQPSLALPAVTPDAVEKVSFQIWVNRKRSVVRSPAAPAVPLKPDFVDGFANTSIDGEMWRAYSVSDKTGKVSVQVGVPRTLLEADLAIKAGWTMAGSLLLLLLLYLAIWSVVCWSLKPVVAIETTVRQKKVFDLTPLPADGLPHEIRPLVMAFNALLSQLNQAVEGERRFIADAAHELRTPLAALQAHVQVALNTRTIAEKDAALEKLLVVAERSGRLSEQLLDLARLETGPRAAAHRPVDLCALVPVVVRDFEATAQLRRQSISVESTPCQIQGDVDELGILVSNLVDNALRYSGEGGAVVVTCGHVERDGKLRGYLRVADDGPGVPPDQRRHIFDRFYRVPGNGGRGSGIGLSLVARIVEFHEASIELGDGLDGRGLCVLILFPALPQTLS